MKLRGVLFFIICTLVIALESPANSSMAQDSGFSGSFEADSYFIPEDDDFTLAIFGIDVSRSHYEVRYNYEDLNTVSFWAGYNLDFPGELSIKAVPIAGFSLGNSTGFMPGLNLDLNYGIAGFSSQLEYFFDTENKNPDFFYAWSELTIQPLDWLYGGVALQRTKVYETESEVQIGIFTGFSYSDFYSTFYFFNPDKSDMAMVLALGVEF